MAAEDQAGAESQGRGHRADGRRKGREIRAEEPAQGQQGRQDGAGREHEARGLGHAVLGKAEVQGGLVLSGVSQSDQAVCPGRGRHGRDAQQVESGQSLNECSDPFCSSRVPAGLGRGGKSGFNQIRDLSFQRLGARFPGLRLLQFFNGVQRFDGGFENRQVQGPDLPLLGFDPLGQFLAEPLGRHGAGVDGKVVGREEANVPPEGFGAVPQIGFPELEPALQGRIIFQLKDGLDLGHDGAAGGGRETGGQPFQGVLQGARGGLDAAAAGPIVEFPGQVVGVHARSRGLGPRLGRCVRGRRRGRPGQSPPPDRRGQLVHGQGEEGGHALAPDPLTHGVEAGFRLVLVSAGLRLLVIAGVLRFGVRFLHRAVRHPQSVHMGKKDGPPFLEQGAVRELVFQGVVQGLGLPQKFLFNDVGQGFPFFSRQGHPSLPGAFGEPGEDVPEFFFKGPGVPFFPQPLLFGQIVPVGRLGGGVHEGVEILMFHGEAALHQVGDLEAGHVQEDVPQFGGRGGHHFPALPVHGLPLGMADVFFVVHLASPLFPAGLGHARLRLGDVPVGQAAGDGGLGVQAQGFQDFGPGADAGALEDVVFEGHEELRLARVPVPRGPAGQLVVQGAVVVPFRPQQAEPPRLSDPPGFVHPVQELPAFARVRAPGGRPQGAEPLGPRRVGQGLGLLGPVPFQDTVHRRQEVLRNLAAQLDVHAPSGHGRDNGDRVEAARLGDNGAFLRVVLGGQDLVLDAGAQERLEFPDPALFLLRQG